MESLLWYIYMHLMQANIGMWLDHQKSLSHWFQAMGAFFLAKNPDFFRKNAEVSSYADYINKQDPDIVYLTEVCWMEQRDLLVSALEHYRYKTHVIEGFELWNMQEESHKYLYHIMGSRLDFEHLQTESQYTSNRLIRFLKWRHQFWKKSPNLATKVTGILDGGGSRYSIWGIEIWLMHAHAMDTTTVFQNLAQWFTNSKNQKQIFAWDMNMQTEISEKMLSGIESNLKRIRTERTYPYYFSQAKQGIFTGIINKHMLSWLLPYPDQVFVNPLGTNISQIKTVGPNITWLKTDHAVNHVYLE
jgi:hypothetical protein